MEYDQTVMVDRMGSFIYTCVPVPFGESQIVARYDRITGMNAVVYLPVPGSGNVYIPYERFTYELIRVRIRGVIHVHA